MSRWRITIVSWHLKWPDFKFSLNSTFTTASIIKVSIPFFFFFVFLKNGKQAGLLNGFYFVSFTYVIWWYLWPCCTADPDPTNIWLILEIKKPFLWLPAQFDVLCTAWRGFCPLQSKINSTHILWGIRVESCFWDTFNTGHGVPGGTTSIV